MPNFVIQGGDPTGAGTGGPGYTTVDKPAANTRYTNGVVAMAKAATEAPGTAGSQFFIVTADEAPWLDGKHTVFGRVTEGMDVVDRIEGTPTDRADRPVEPIRIESIELES